MAAIWGTNRPVIPAQRPSFLVKSREPWLFGQETGSESPPISGTGRVIRGSGGGDPISKFGDGKPAHGFGHSVPTLVESEQASNQLSHMGILLHLATRTPSHEQWLVGRVSDVFGFF